MYSRKRKTIGVFISKAFSYFDDTLFRCLKRECKRLDYDVIVFTTVGNRENSNYYDTQEMGIFSFAPVESLDGIIVVPESFERAGFREALFDMLKTRATCPIIAIRHKSNTLSCVFTDESNAIRPLIRHLIEHHGIRKIAFLAGFPGHTDSELRLKVYREEMAAHSLAVAEGAVYYGTMWYNCGEEAYAHYFSGEAERPEAIVCANDYMAVGLLQVLQEHGVRVPEDVIVTGFDNLPGHGIELPKLTTIQPDFNGMVTQAMDYLDQQIRSKQDKAQEITRISLPGQLILGETCGCCKRPTDFHRRISHDAVNALESFKQRQVCMTYLSIELSACEDLNDLHRALIQKIDDFPAVQDLYVCLFEKERKQENGVNAAPAYAKVMTDTMCLVHAMCDRQDYGMPMVSFPRAQLLPPMALHQSEAHLFYLKLLHQKGYFYGYALYEYNGDEVPTDFFTQYNILLSGALQNIQKREELRALYEERRQSSITDLLTGLHNRRGLMENVDPIWARLCAQRESVAFICFDMDYLKQINDTFGHAAGDFALRLVGRALQLSAPRNAVTARIGGDEFIVFLPETDQKAADRFVADFDKKLEQLNKEENRSFIVTASAGFALVELNDLTTIEQCIQLSDDVMYRVKEKRHAVRK